jgi:hypothetical protein
MIWVKSTSLCFLFFFIIKLSTTNNRFHFIVILRLTLKEKETFSWSTCLALLNTVPAFLVKTRCWIALVISRSSGPSPAITDGTHSLFSHESKKKWIQPYFHHYLHLWSNKIKCAWYNPCERRSKFKLHAYKNQGKNKIHIGEPIHQLIIWLTSWYKWGTPNSFCTALAIMRWSVSSSIP